nr:SPASM domain-containing protein [uncultured Acetatifactor sp.]
MLPCSFDNQQMHWAMDLRKHTIEEAWNSQRFSEFRKIMADACPECDKRENCMGGCPICPEIVLCGQTSRRQIYQYTESGYTEARYIETLNTEQGEKQT